MPPSCHISLTLANCVKWRDLVTDVKACIEMMKRDPKLNKTADAATYGLAEKIPDSSLFKYFINLFIECLLEVY